jgi:serine/threonine protein kinase
VKVTDFGVAADEFGLKVDGGNVSGYVPDDVALERNLTGETGTYRWMAPEVIRHEPYSAMADVYSFAIIIWQLVTRDEPFQDVDAIEAAKLVANEKMRPPLPENIPQTIANLINVNWSDNSSDRWKFEKVAESLDEIKSSITFEERTFLDAAEGHPVYVYEEAEMRAGPSDLNIKAKKPPTKASNLLGNFFGMQKKFGKGKGK